jgi:hypothetical protein
MMNPGAANSRHCRRNRLPDLALTGARRVLDRPTLRIDRRLTGRPQLQLKVATVPQGPAEPSHEIRTLQSGRAL